MHTTIDGISPRILLVEDDPTSQRFLCSALESMPARVDCADSAATALSIAADVRHDLWLIDVNLPDGSGDRLLARLRALRSPFPPALAHTADLSPEIRQTMLRAGFCSVLPKPITSVELLSRVRGALPMNTGSDWDDQAALIALGNSAHIPVLRQMFLDELPSMRNNIMEAAHNGDLPTLRACLHRLQASCGFVGATRLAASVTDLRTTPTSTVALERFQEAANALLLPR